MTKERVGVEFRAVNNLIRRYFEFSSGKREIDRVTGNNGWIIVYLAEHPDQDVFQKDIEEHFTIAPSTVSKVLSLMEQKRLIQRLAVEQDARLKKVVLTDKALEIKEIMSQEAEKMETALLRGFGEEEVKTLLSYLNKMKENISTALGNK